MLLFCLPFCCCLVFFIHYSRSPSSFTIIINHPLYFTFTLIIHNHHSRSHSQPSFTSTFTTTTHVHHHQVRARLRQEARFSTLARAMEGAASRGHDQCCELLWECCDLKSKQRSVAAAELNGHNALMRNMSLWLKAEK